MLGGKKRKMSYEAISTIVGFCLGFLAHILIRSLYLSKKNIEMTLEEMKSRFPGKQVEETKEGFNIVIADMPFAVDKEGNYIWGNK